MRPQSIALGTLLALTITGLAHAGWRDMLDSLTGGAGSQSSTATTGLTDAEIGDGLREALAVGASRAVDILARRGGYLDDPQVRIPLPKPLQTAAKGLRMVGKGQLVDDFETTVNRAAEQAVAKTLPIVKDTVRDMSLQDVRAILSGADDAATQYLRQHAGTRLQEAVRPIVAQATDAAGATAAYKRLSGQVSSGLGGLVDSSTLDLDDYVTTKTLDGLYTKLADEERRIRQNPVARTTDLLKKVFGS